MIPIENVQLTPTTHVSCVGMGGHYKAMEEGQYENRFADVDRFQENHSRLVHAAVEAGVTYFDTTWRNEVEMLGRALACSGRRDRVFVNGMVLGAFNGPKAQSISPEDYFNRWLDDRLSRIPGHRFDSFMINAVEEGYDEKICERLIALLERRRSAGDLKLIGISSHSHTVARQVLDRFPQFDMAMLPYNYHTRSNFDQAFADYEGNASFIAMKTLVWAEYGIPFCALNRLSRFREIFGFEPVDDIQSRAISFTLHHPLIRIAVSSVNSPEELQGLVRAGQTTFENASDEDTLRRYQDAMQKEGGLFLFLSALESDNLRMNYFGAANLARLLGIAMPDIPLNEPKSLAQIRTFAAKLKTAAASQHALAAV